MKKRTWSSAERERNSVQKTESTETTVYAMLTAINGDPVSYHEAVIATDKLQWIEAINNELESMNKNQVWRLVDRKTASSDGKRQNIIDSRWVLKKKTDI